MFMGMNEQEIQEYKDMKDSVIFLIDCHKSMYAQNVFNGKPEFDNDTEN